MIHVNRVVFQLLADTKQFERSVDRVISKTMQMTRSFSSMGSLLGRAGMFSGSAVAGGLAGGILGLLIGGGIGLASAGFSLIETGIRDVANGIQHLGEYALKAGTYVAEAGMKFEAFRIDFETMSGSVGKGNKLFEELLDLTVRTPYTFEQLARGSQLLLGMGVGSDQVGTVMEKLSAIAGSNAIRLQRLALAYGQVVSAGRFMGNELRQFTEAGVGAQDFAAANNMTGSQLRDKMRAGEATVAMMVNGINSITGQGGRFAGRNERMLETVHGQWIALWEKVEISAGRFGEKIFHKIGLADRIKGIGNLVSNADGVFGPGMDVFFDKFGTWIDNAEPSLQKIADIFGTIAVSIWHGLEALYEYAPTWSQVESVLENIQQNVLPAIAGLIQVMVSQMLQFVTGLVFIVDNLLPEKGESGSNYDNMNWMWKQFTGRDYSDSAKSTKYALAKMTHDVNNANWYQTAMNAGTEWKKISGSLSNAASKTDAMAAITGGIVPAAAEVARGFKKIAVPLTFMEHKISEGAMKLSDELFKQQEEGLFGFDKMKIARKRLMEAFWGTANGQDVAGKKGPLDGQKFMDIPGSVNGRLLGALGGGAMYGDIFAPNGPLAGKPELFWLGMVNAFERARSGLSGDENDPWKKIETKLPEAITRGSKEAASIAQRSIAAAKQEIPLDERQKALKDLARIAAADEKAKEKLETLVELFKELMARGGMQGLGF